MRILIVGAGLVGSTLARHLVKVGYDVAIVDNSLTQLNELSEKLDILTVHGNGVNPSVLETAGIKDAEILIAATPSDELNIVVCAIGQLHDVKRRFARIRNDELANQVSSENLKKLGVSHVIQPETAVVERILQFVDTPGVKDAVNFHDDNLLLRGIELNESMPVCGISLAKMQGMYPKSNLLVVAVIREGIGIIPLGDFVLESGDIAYIMYEKSSQDVFLRLS
ncbi:MAG: NAD-binding protein, partial [Candidatus Marinimicrobia bacterium]|nr:NAD-binding protein [Candidatus Neomarinimicrobiota bacterium]